MIRPFNEHFQDYYWSRGAAEKTFVYLDGNELPERFAGGRDFALGELGFGTGLTFLLAVDLWERTAPMEAQLTYMSYEMLPLCLEELREIHREFPGELQGLSVRFLEIYRPLAGWNVWEFGNVILKLFIGDARVGIAAQKDEVDAWFLDGFSPALNPEIWEESLLQQVGKLTKSGGTATTYSVAAAVRERLATSGFKIEKVRGFPPKEHMLKAVKV